ncbi:MAG: AlpA family phage regulatory protein [Rhodobacteraceae bacterium]|nr:AlpA family phage regulatory protein [Paracoccaceae bacterium]
MTETILRRPKVKGRTGLSDTLLYDKLNPKSPYHDSTFPKPVRLGKRAVGWRESEINAWIEARESASST